MTENLATSPDIIPSLNRLMDSALKLNRNNFTVIVNFSGHIASVTVQCLAGGWEANAKPALQWSVYTDGHQTDAEVVTIIEGLEAASRNNDKMIAEIENKRLRDEREQYERLKAKYDTAA